MQPIQINKHYKLTKEIYDQIIALDKNNVSRSEIGRRLKLNRSTMARITKLLIDKGIWQKSSRWITRENTLKAKALKGVRLKTPKNETSVVRAPKVENFININFKGVNVQIEKTSNIIITQNVIVIK